MSKTIVRYYRGFALLLFVCSEGGAASLVDLMARSDAVVIGSVQSRSENLASVSFEISIERVLKGTITGPTVHITHPWNSPLSPSPSAVSQRIRGMWFLHRVGPSDWDVWPAKSDRLATDLCFPVSEGPLNGPYSYAPDTVQLDMLVLEVGAGCEVCGT